MSSEHLYSEETKKILEFADEIMRLKAEVKKLVEVIEMLDGFLKNQGYSDKDPLVRGLAKEALKPYQK